MFGVGVSRSHKEERYNDRPLLQYLAGQTGNRHCCFPLPVCTVHGLLLCVTAPNINKTKQTLNKEQRQPSITYRKEMKSGAIERDGDKRVALGSCALVCHLAHP